MHCTDFVLVKFFQISSDESEEVKSKRQVVQKNIVRFMLKTFEFNLCALFPRSILEIQPIPSMGVIYYAPTLWITAFASLHSLNLIQDDKDILRLTLWFHVYRSHPTWPRGFRRIVDYSPVFLLPVREYYKFLRSHGTLWFFCVYQGH